MHFYRRVADIQAYIAYQKSQGHTIGFAPTMGALHNGHMSLIQHANEQSDISVASIFVNPTQFNESSDLEKYPRTLEADIYLLYENHLNALFAPQVSDIYPEQGIHTPNFNFQNLDTVLEGEFRAGHFAGVAQVVYRLLEIVRPDHLYMGQKDYQQWTIIYHLLDQTDLETELIMVPTVREVDGLAMSSRNRRLTPEWREKAPMLSKLLARIQGEFENTDIDHLVQLAEKELKEAGFNPEYFRIVDGYTLQPVKDPKAHKKVVACVAAWAGEIRLIDNMILRDDL